MQTKRRDLFTTIRTEGAILPADLLQRIADGDRSLEGLKPDDYHRAGERLNEVINGAWNRLLGQWQTFRTALGKLPEGDPATSVTRERWLLPLFRELDYGRLATAMAIEINGKSYPVSHAWQKTPIHLVGSGIDMDRRTAGVAGAARSSPHSLVQELLNQSDEHLWGFVSNGRRLRILRDNISLTRQAFVEFDLEAMMDGEVYADFALLWLLCHQSRVEGDRLEQCWLEKWSRTAQKTGTRALDSLRQGVEDAIKALGRGFLAHQANSALRQKLRDGGQKGGLDTLDYYRQVLRLVYRLLFLFAAEDRGLLLLPSADEKTRKEYARYYSTARLRHLAERHRGTRHGDLYQGLAVVMQKLGTPGGCPKLGLPALGSFLWSDRAMPVLADCRIANADFLEAARALAFTVDGNVLRAVDYKNLGAEELGSVYESLLELRPKINADAATFELDVAAGHERKTTGSYYTPTSLITCLLDSALEPVLGDAMKSSREPSPSGRGQGEGGKAQGQDRWPLDSTPEQRILSLKICDPACGSGHFLIAAAHRIAKRLAAVRTGDEEPAPEAYRAALRDVIGHCIFGVDINPMAVELCKINLWLESLEPGKPLSFLDHHIQCGNSLLGATPALLNNGIPDEAFTPIEGDNKKVCTEYKKLNRDERRGQKTFFTGGGKPWERMGDVAVSLANLEQIHDDSLDAVRNKEERYAQLVGSADYLSGRFWADTWCAAFVWKKTKPSSSVPTPSPPGFDYGITEEVFRRIERNPHDCTPWMRAEIQRLAQQYRFFQWHLAFPQAFRVPGDDGEPDNEQAGWSGGFDVILGNPPWERVKLQEKEWFAERSPIIANAPNAAARKRLIQSLSSDDPALYQNFLDDCRKAEGESALMRNSGRYPLCGRGDVNTYTIFAELNRTLVTSHGLVGCIVPSGIATDDTTKFFFQDVVGCKALVSLFDFENKGLFPGVHSSYKFCLFTSGRGTQPITEQAAFIFFAHGADDLRDPERRFTLSAEDIALLNPNTRTCPIFRAQRDAELTKAIYRRVPVLIREAQGDRPEENPWGIKFSTMFHMSNDSHLFRTREQLETEGWRLQGNIFRKDGAEYLPLYEAKMVDFFDHRAADIRISTEALQRKAQPAAIADSEKMKPDRTAMPLFWIAQSDWQAALPRGYDGNWMLGFASVTSPTNARTFCPALVPKSGAGNSFPIIMTTVEPSVRGLLLASTSAYCFDYVARQKVGGVNLNFFLIQQFPIHPQQTYAQPSPWSDGDGRQTLRDWLVPRVLELAYTAWDLEPFARDSGWSGPPFRWDQERRFLLRCELDAAFFHLYVGSSEWRVASGETDKQLAELKMHFPTPCDAVAYIMDTFPIVKRKDEQQHGEYRTKRVILEIYDAMAAAIRTGRPYQTLLDPPPADPRVAHQPKK
jgi:hypothetical protein